MTNHSYFGPFLPSPDVWPAAIANKIKSLFGSQSRSQRSEAENSNLSIGVVIPVYNEGKESLLKTLRDLESSTLNPERVHVVVVDGGCTDDTMEAVADLLESDCVNVTHPGSQTDRARGFTLKMKTVTLNKNSTQGNGRGPALNCGVNVSDFFVRSVR
jgi:cellulose synthase/poly-beta-1,6-N-acetylglucosamine synthase-like glycosyltransferase